MWLAFTLHDLNHTTSYWFYNSIIHIYLLLHFVVLSASKTWILYLMLGPKMTLWVYSKFKWKRLVKSNDSFK